MADKARHAFGSLVDVESALSEGKINSYDILFLDGDTEPKVGWIDRNGELKLVKNDADLSGVTEDIKRLERQVEAAANEHLIAKYEITSTPDGALVDYREKEIRVMCPVDTQWVKQAVGSTGNANMYYMGFKAYAPEGAVSFKEGDRGVIIDEMFDFSGDFAGTDEYGRNYSICWLALASYDEATDSWTYFGKNSSAEKYIGWDYVVEWYNAEGKVIASDGVRINLSNEECHYLVQPYYMADVMKEVDAKIAAVSGAVEVIEF